MAHRILCGVVDVLKPSVLQASCRGRVRYRAVKRWYRPTTTLNTEPSEGPAHSINEELQLSDSCVKVCIYVHVQAMIVLNLSD